MSAAPQVPLAEFSRARGPARVPVSSRMAGGGLTSVLYALFAIFWQQSSRAPSDTQTLETIAILLPDTPRKKLSPLPPPFLAHLIRPRVEAIAPPTFTIASAGPVAPAQLPASAANTSSIDGGLPAGTGAKGAGASANGSGGNGDGLAGCFDEAWGRSVTERVGRFFYYPGAARAAHTTGWVMVHFIVRRDGRLKCLEIGKSSGDQGLDSPPMRSYAARSPCPECRTACIWTGSTSSYLSSSAFRTCISIPAPEIAAERRRIPLMGSDTDRLDCPQHQFLDPRANFMPMNSGMVAKVQTFPAITISRSVRPFQKNGPKSFRILDIQNLCFGKSANKAVVFAA